MRWVALGLIAFLILTGCEEVITQPEQQLQEVEIKVAEQQMKGPTACDNGVCVELPYCDEIGKSKPTHGTKGMPDCSRRGQAEAAQ